MWHCDLTGEPMFNSDRYVSDVYHYLNMHNVPKSRFAPGIIEFIVSEEAFILFKMKYPDYERYMQLDTSTK